ncbi:MAG: hypothetical protein AAF392_02390 [Bacteroidota bacterium]
MARKSLCSGKASLQWKQPCAASDLMHVRKQLGKEGIQALSVLSVQLYGQKLAKATQAWSTLLHKEKSITYPTEPSSRKKP